jgi:hypothetical protein
MSGAIPPLPFMAWCSVKKGAQGQLTFTSYTPEGRGQDDQRPYLKAQATTEKREPSASVSGM